MSNLTADHLFPLFLALPVEEQEAFAVKINKQIAKNARPKKKKKDIYDEIGDIYRPENIEMLVAQIMNPPSPRRGNEGKAP